VDRKKCFVRPLVCIVGTVCLVLVLCYLFRSSLLTGLAHAWVVDEPLTKADAIVVLGGRPDLRPFEAAQLFHQGLATQILYMDVKLDPAAELHITQSEREVTHKVLLSQGVPETAMTAIGDGVTSTFDESVAVRAWAETNHAKSLIIPTDLSHTRRVRWLFRRQLNGIGTKVELHAITPKEYSITNWWRREQGLIAFQNEVIKSVYYQIKY